MKEPHKIDETDAIILRQLLRESRTSFTELAKTCGITVGAVRMRYKKLWKLGIINGEIMQVNPQSLGYNCIVDIGVLTRAEDQRKVIESLRNRPYIQYAIGVFGKFNLSLKVALSNMEQLSSILEELESNSGILEVGTMMWGEMVNVDHPENLTILPTSVFTRSQSIPYNPMATRQPIEMDAIDRKIAGILSKHSRTTFRKIAEQTGISTKNVIQRYRRLRGNVLTMSSITVNLSKLGYHATAFSFIKVASKSKLPEIYNQIIHMPNLIFSVKIIGPYDIAALAALQDFNALFQFKEQIRKIQGIEEFEFYLGPPEPCFPINLFQNLL